MVSFSGPYMDHLDDCWAPVMTAQERPAASSRFDGSSASPAASGVAGTASRLAVSLACAAALTAGGSALQSAFSVSSSAPSPEQQVKSSQSLRRSRVEYVGGSASAGSLPWSEAQAEALSYAGRCGAVAAGVVAVQLSAKRLAGAGRRRGVAPKRFSLLPLQAKGEEDGDVGATSSSAEPSASATDAGGKSAAAADVSGQAQSIRGLEKNGSGKPQITTMSQEAVDSVVQGMTEEQRAVLMLLTSQAREQKKGVEGKAVESKVESAGSSHKEQKKAEQKKVKEAVKEYKAHSHKAKATTTAPRAAASQEEKKASEEKRLKFSSSTAASAAVAAAPASTETAMPPPTSESVADAVSETMASTVSESMSEDVLEKLEGEMHDLASAGDFMGAAAIRDKISHASLDDDLAVIRANSQLYEAISAKSLEQMEALWLPAGFSRCIHPYEKPSVGQPDVVKSWSRLFKAAAASKSKITPTDVTVTVRGTTATVVCVEQVTSKSMKQPLRSMIATNVFRKVNGNWLLYHRHVSPADEDDGATGLFMGGDEGVVVDDQALARFNKFWLNTLAARGKAGNITFRLGGYQDADSSSDEEDSDEEQAYGDSYTGSSKRARRERDMNMAVEEMTLEDSDDDISSDEDDDEIYIKEEESDELESARDAVRALRRLSTEGTLSREQKVRLIGEMIRNPGESIAERAHELLLLEADEEEKQDAWEEYAALVKTEVGRLESANVHTTRETRRRASYGDSSQAAGSGGMGFGHSGGDDVDKKARSKTKRREK
eukprot:TRINITY_DN124012_c0_g1_i1.p1 TRINITY_DN124012_c0_g1~~TRINITY_DN124012_c0_g1_i1.p1  ORF type:complete len:775 (+),score=236.75 TRINITY_DN124012_c0_g1_i1:81-2405(+)